MYSCTEATVGWCISKATASVRLCDVKTSTTSVNHDFYQGRLGPLLLLLSREATVASRCVKFMRVATNEDELRYAGIPILLIILDNIGLVGALGGRCGRYLESYLVLCVL